MSYSNEYAQTWIGNSNEKTAKISKDYKNWRVSCIASPLTLPFQVHPRTWNAGLWTVSSSSIDPHSTSVHSTVADCTQNRPPPVAADSPINRSMRVSRPTAVVNDRCDISLRPSMMQYFSQKSTLKLQQRTSNVCISLLLLCNIDGKVTGKKFHRMTYDDDALHYSTMDRSKRHL